MGLRYDVHAKLAPNGAALATDIPCIAGSRRFTVQHMANGSGEFRISRHASVATSAIIARGNWVKAYLTQLSTDEPLFTFQLETGDFDVISGDEEGGEILSFGGPGNRSYLKNGRIWPGNFMGANPINVRRRDSWHWFDDQYGDILKRFLDEDAARPTPTMPAITYAWTSTQDTASQAWPSFEGDFWLSIGMTYLEALDLMQDYDDLYVRMTPDFEMQAYTNDYGVDRSSTSFGSGKVRFVKGVNIKGDLEKNIFGPTRYTHMVVAGSDYVFQTATDPNYSEGQERREGFLAHGETNSLRNLLAAGLKKIKEGEKDEEALAWTGTITDNAPLLGNYYPGPVAAGGHFWEGDWITVDTGPSDLDYVNKTVQVISVTYIELDSGDVDYIVEADGDITAGSSADGAGEDCCGEPGSQNVPPSPPQGPRSLLCNIVDQSEPSSNLISSGTGYGGFPFKAADCDEATEWITNSFPVSAQFWGVDMLAAYSVSKWRIYQTLDAGSAASQVMIWATNDEAKYNAITYPYNFGTAGWDLITTVAVSPGDNSGTIAATALYRYWVFDAAAGGGNGWAVNEFELWEPGTAPPSLGGPGEGSGGTPGNSYTPNDAVIEHGDLSSKGGTMHDASQIKFTPAGTIEATDVQAAIVEAVAEAGSASPGYGGPYGYGYRRDIVIATDFGVQPGTARGLLGAAPENVGWFTNNNGQYCRFQFPEAIRMTALRLWQSGTHTHGYWFIEGSNNGTDWTELSRQLFGGAAIVEYAFTNLDKYSYYQIRHDDTSAAGHNGPYQQYIAFRSSY